MAEDWWDDENHPMFGPFRSAVKRGWSHLDQGWPQKTSPIWPGRGLAGELGARAYAAWQAERPGWWPEVLAEFEWDLMQRGLA